MKKTAITLAVLLSAWALSMPGHAGETLSVSRTAPELTENFNSMWDASSSSPTLVLPRGWRVDRNLTAPRRVGKWVEASAEVMYAGGENLASNAKNGTWVFGAGDADRAVGGLSTTVSGGTRCVNVMTAVTNNDPDMTVTWLDLGYDIEKYRYGANAAGFAVQLYSSYDGDKWTSAGDDFLTYFAPDATTAGAPTVPVATEAVDSKLRVHIEPGSTVYLAWNISVASGTTPDKAQGLAVDNVSVAAQFELDDPGWVDPETPEINHSGIFIRGEVNGWAADPEWEFDKLTDTTFRLKDKTLSGAFKIGGESWTDGINYGTNGQSIVMGEPYITIPGENSGNISCGGNSYPCSSVELTIADGAATITLLPDTSMDGVKEIFAVGDFNGWNYMDASGRLTAEGDGTYSGRITMTAAADGLSHWRLYLRRAMAGVWGLPADATSASLGGALTRDASGNIATAPGTYDITVTLNADGTGSYSLSAVESAPADMTLWPLESTLTPALPDQICILSLNNSLIHYNDQAAMFNSIASAMGNDAEWTKHTLLGKPLSTHWDEGDGLTEAGTPGAKMMIRKEAWSHIILQEQSSLPRTNPEQFRLNVATWVEYIRDNCPNPNAVIILPVNWAYSGDWSNFTRFNRMFEQVYSDVAARYGLVICPVMTAYQNRFEQAGADGLAAWFQDDRHPTDLSTYMAACMEWGVIYGRDPRQITWAPQTLSASEASAMRTYAADAIAATAQTVDHHNATIAFRATVTDPFGLTLEPEGLTYSVNGDGATVTSDGVFTAPAHGTYTVTATASGFSRSATVTVTDHITQVEETPAIKFTDSDLGCAEDFDTLGDSPIATLPDGWRIDRTDAPRQVGTFRDASPATTYAGGVSLPSNASNGVWNFGPDPTDRAVGGITTGVAGGTRAVNVYAHLVNEASRTIDAVTLSYDIEKYRDGANAAGFRVQLYTSTDGRNWTSAGDEFLTEFPASPSTSGAAVVPIETVGNSGPVATRSFGPGCDLYLAWNISVTSGDACNGAPALALDNVTIQGTLAAVPQYKWHIYVDDRTGYAALGAYAYGDSELWGAWPGQAPIDNVTDGDTRYKVFGHDADTGRFNLILNNWNQSLQLPDYPIEGGRDYYLRADQERVTEVGSGVGTVAPDPVLAVSYDGSTLSCPGASSITLVTTAGQTVRQTAGTVLATSSLPAGVYLAVIASEAGQSVTKIAVR